MSGRLAELRTLRQQVREARQHQTTSASCSPAQVGLPQLLLSLQESYHVLERLVARVYRGCDLLRPRHPPPHLRVTPPPPPSHPFLLLPSQKIFPAAGNCSSHSEPAGH
eukprot:763658-Hanusia_phi.AAC.1